FEIEGVTEEVAREAMDRAIYKLPLKSKFIIREDVAAAAQAAASAKQEA
ncbi:MAG TPA: 50S ribosomal protein L16, partial [Candidatus Sumerlaeota bacterium]|nr:50S ribosomal protein L16 [Candidatus Sumerlaeota bacterium]